MTQKLVLFPHQLFEEAGGLEPDKVFVEHPRFFTKFQFHKQKLVLHRASMKAFQDKLEADYIEYDEKWEKLFEENDKLLFYDPVDKKLRQEIQELAKENEVEIEIKQSPMFLTSIEWNREYFSKNSYFQLPYYKKQRKRLDVLVDKEGKPEGGKWSYDTENREKMPEDLEQPEIPRFNGEKVEEAKEYVEKNFPDNPGSLENFFYPTTHEEARENLEDFLKNRLENFGKYQDAFDRRIDFGFHSLISPSLNIGLLTPAEVVEKTLEMHEKNDYPLNSVEGFLRQVIGWREYIRAVYELEAAEMRDANFWNADNSIPEEFYTAETGLPPVDEAIERVEQNCYTHHIERLMVLGNVMLLLEIDPDEVYRWFMEMFIDSYDWVMVPNVYGMSQYSDDRIMTKPYISSSNYVGKMSHYESGEWENLWDGLYWSFIRKHREKIENIQRMSFMTSHLDRMDEETLKQHEENAEKLRYRLQ